MSLKNPKLKGDKIPVIIDKWFIIKYVGLGFLVFSLIDMLNNGVSSVNTSLGFLGFCFVLSAII